jgi:STE24 endopeptidase
MNPYLAVIVGALALRWFLELLADWLNLRNAGEKLPAEFEGWYDAGKYAESQRYLRERTAFGIVSDTVHTGLLIAFILLGGFAALDAFARGFGLGPLPTALVFAGGLLLLSTALELPFSVYVTFRLEQKYGFNRTTPRTFVMDQVKGLALSALIGGAIFAAVVWFFERAGAAAWLYAWAAVSAFEFLLAMVAPALIMPLFNRFEPLEDGEVRRAVERYAAEQRFRMRGVFRMDGSRRSSKTNAFFTGLGRFRRIVLLDTLLDRHSPPELLGVVAHEMGHHRLGHIPLAVARAVVVSGIAFFLLSRFIGDPGLAAAFGVNEPSTGTSLVFFGILFAPLGMVFSVVEGALSRRHEFAADAFAARTTGNPAALCAALKRLSVDNLGNLTPHPFKVWLGDSHPPVLARLRALEGAARSA